LRADVPAGERFAVEEDFEAGVVEFLGFGEVSGSDGSTGGRNQNDGD
jgi:hypothetical protein